jgi:hypothetical protein
MAEVSELRDQLTSVLRELGGPVAEGVAGDEPSALLTALTGLIEARDLVDALNRAEATN